MTPERATEVLLQIEQEANGVARTALVLRTVLEVDPGAFTGERVARRIAMLSMDRDAVRDSVAMVASAVNATRVPWWWRLWSKLRSKLG